MTNALQTSNAKPQPPNTTPVRAVVFDLDGLMFNTEALYNQAGRELLRRRGKELTPDLLCAMMGRRAPEALAILREMHELPESVEELVAESRRLLFALFDDGLEPMPGLLELLELLEARGLPKAVATSSALDYVEEVLSRFELVARFDFLLTAEDVTHGKPHPEIYLTAAARFGVAPPEMLVLEDSQTGVRAAKAAGARCIAVPHEHSRDHDFALADAVVQRLDAPEVLALIGAAEGDRPGARRPASTP